MRGRADSKNNLKKLQEQINKVSTNSTHTIKTISSSAYLTTAIKEIVNKYTIDMVVMGTKGATGAKKVFMGSSNTVNVIKDTIKTPILVVPDNAEFLSLKTIAFFTDFNKVYSTIELYSLLDLAELYDSKIRIVHIKKESELDTNQQINKNVLVHHLENFKTSFHWVPYTVSKEKTILDFIEDTDASMLAMINYPHSFIEKITREPVINKLGFRSLVPFLVMPNLS